MWGLLAHHNADAVKIVCVGEFTRDAAAFAQGKAIDLINGERLLDLVKAVQSPAADRWPEGASHAEPALYTKAPDTPVSCPSCDAEMVRRKNRSTGVGFWGCANYPRCKGTRPVAAET
jgi:restriction system protein